MKQACRGLVSNPSPLDPARRPVVGRRVTWGGLILAEEIVLATIAGDGIGPEVVAAGMQLVNYVQGHGGPRFAVTALPWGSNFYHETGRMMPEDGLQTLQRFDAVLLGAIGSQGVADHIAVRDLILKLRFGLDLYANLRPVKLLPGAPCPLADKKPFDMLFVRENTEGEYAGMGGRSQRGAPMETAVQVASFSRMGIARIARVAFEKARQRGQGVTSVTKSNALEFGMVFWDEVLAEVAKEYPDVPFQKVLVDAMAYHMVRDPARFGVVVASNLFGDILTDLGAALQGGLGLAASANINPERRRPAMFEPVHGSAPDIAGRGIANPLATFLSIGMMLEHMSYGEWNARIEAGVAACLQHGPKTPDLGGSAKTEELTQFVLGTLH